MKIRGNAEHPPNKWMAVAAAAAGILLLISNFDRLISFAWLDLSDLIVPTVARAPRERPALARAEMSTLNDLRGSANSGVTKLDARHPVGLEQKEQGETVRPSSQDLATNIRAMEMVPERPAAPDSPGQMAERKAFEAQVTAWPEAVNSQIQSGD